MAINEISKGVYYVSAPKTEKYKMSNAGNYTSVYTKGKAQAFDLSLEQAKLKMANEQAAYLAELEAYNKRAQALEKQLADLTAAALSDNLEAKREAYKNYVDTKAQIDKDNADRAVRASELVYPLYSESRETGSPFGFGTQRAAKAVDDRQKNIITEIVTRYGANTAKSIEEINKAIGPGGILNVSTPEEAAAVRGMALNEVYEKRLAQDSELAKDPDAALALIVAEANKADPGESYSNALLQLRQDLQRQMAGGGGKELEITRKSTPQTKRRFAQTGKDTEFPELSPSQVEAPQIDPIQLYAAQRDIQRRLDELKALKPSQAPSGDIITEARDIFAGRFGPPTLGSSAPYRQRLVADALLKMSPEKRAQFLKDYAAATAVTPPAAAAPAAPATPAPSATTAPATAPAPAAPAAPATAVTPPAAAAPATAPAPAAPATAVTPPAAAAPAPAAGEVPSVTTTPVSPQAASALEASLRKTLESSPVKPPTPPPAAPTPIAPEFDGVPRGPTGYPIITDPVTGRQQTFDSSSPTGILILDPGTTAAPPAKPAATPQPQAPISPQTPAPSVTVSPQELNRKAEMEMLGMPAPVTAPVAPKAPAPAAATPEVPKASLPASGTASTDKGKRVLYLQKVFNDAKDLLSKPKQFERVIASGVGRQAAEIYNGNRSANKDFKRTMEQITLDFSDSPEDRSKAHTVAMALELKNKDLQKLPKLEA